MLGFLPLQVGAHKMPSYFHLCSVQLSPGSVIEPGNWGRIIELYPQDNNVSNAWRTAVEQVFEATRLQLTPDAPSRLTSAFAFLSQADAERQRPQMGWLNMLYEVELVDPDAVQHIGVFDLLTAAYVIDGTRFLPKARGLATQYWSGSAADGTKELVTASPLRIVRRIS
ncbi:hypothetical protein [Paraburkholderia acidiphila]|uniref:Uncharacterized protein n=1 Tax=Paraburkholderia acidiphila TaxID=2571747 RepID=A0A7Z2G7W6_9BURK|nr:hypothetical protein [Paraburkholderia acidiphila]QGZ56699.1 hypothetical protein FAZ97_17185 [Paraburkholderia acidiphila]